DVAPVVLGGEEAWLPLGGKLRLRAQRRDPRISHRDRAGDPGLGVGHRHEGGPAADVGAWTWVLPRRAVQLVLYRLPQQLMPAGRDLARVDARRVAVMGAQLGWMFVGERPHLDRPRSAGQRPDR